MKSKKILACGLAFAMIFGMLSIPGFAADEAAQWSGTADVSWYSGTETAFSIRTAEELAGLAELVNGGTDFKGKTVTLAANIDLAGKEWIPAGKTSNPFGGIFDGDGYTVSNLKVNNTELDGAGLFGVCRNGEIKNVTVNNADIRAKASIAAIAGESYTSKVTNCAVTGLVQIEGNYKVGGISGYAYVNITECAVEAAEGSYIKGSYAMDDFEGDNVGGICGYLAEGNHGIYGCSVSNVAVSGVRKVGGISGTALYGNTLSGCEIRNTTVSYNEEGVPSTYNKLTSIGGIVGELNRSTQAIIIADTSLTDVMVIGKTGAEDAAGLYIGSDRSKAEAEIVAQTVTVSGITSTNSTAENANGKYDTALFAKVKIGEKAYRTLAEAMEAAQDKDIIEVLEGEYPDNIVINKAITLKGSENAVFSGVIKVTADGAALDGVKLHYEGMRGGSDAEGVYGNIYIQANNVTVKNCDFYAAYDAASTGIGSEFGMVWIPWEPENVVFDNCIFQTNTMGIFPTMKTGEIKNCTFKPLDEGDTRKSLAINNGQMQNVKITSNTFNGGRILTNNAEFTGNQFLGFTSKVVIWNTDPIDLSGSYWGCENPDFDTLIGTDGKLIVQSYYKAVEQDGSLSELIDIPADLTKVIKKVILEPVINGENASTQVNVYLEGFNESNEAALIENLVAVDLDFAVTGGFAIAGLEPVNDEWTYEIKEDNRYLIYEKGKINGTSDLSGQKILLGTLTLEGYGDGTITAAAVNQTVEQRSKDGQNLVISSVAESGTLNLKISVPTSALTVNVAFNNAISDNAAAYQAMKATITGGDLTEDIVVDFGSDKDTKLADNVYRFTAELTENVAYTIAITGEGYRTARYTVNMTKDKTLNFWNNAKDSAAEVEEGNTNSKKTVTYLAGDIVKDNNINIYDLSAVVSYFGTIADTNAYSKYAKYDLNRDGKIDSKDVAMVLVSWGK